jgi:hypothetical protein
MSHKWEVYCVSEGRFVVTDWLKKKPDTCPNNSRHVVSGCRVLESRAQPITKGIVFRGETTPCVVYDKLQPGVYSEVTTLLFEGTDLLSRVRQVRVLGYSTGGAVVRIIDLATGLELASGALPSEDDSVADLALPLEWPVGEAQLSVQVKVASAATVTLKNLTMIMFT